MLVLVEERDFRVALVGEKNMQVRGQLGSHVAEVDVNCGIPSGTDKGEQGRRLPWRGWGEDAESLEVLWKSDNSNGTGLERIHIG